VTRLGPGSLIRFCPPASPPDDPNWLPTFLVGRLHPGWVLHFPCFIHVTSQICNSLNRHHTLAETGPFAIGLVSRAELQQQRRISLMRGSL